MLHLLASRLKRREDTEFEQAIIRICLGLAWLSYLHWVKSAHSVAPEVILTAYAFILACVLGLIWTIVDLNVSVLRRSINMLLDISLTSYTLYKIGDYGAPLFGAYLFLIFGYGFRYGNKYLYASTVFSVIGFSLVAAYGDYWQQNQALSYGIITCIIVLSFYSSSLIAKLQNAVNASIAANEAKSQFLATMSHEIRTPLNGVIGMSDLMLHTELNTDQTDIAKTIKDSAWSLLYLVNDILDISKIEAGKIEIENIEFNIHALANSMVNALSHDAREKGLTLKSDVSPEVPVYLVGDPQHIRQIISNILNNAIKFTDKGHITFNISLLENSSNNYKIRFEIADTGIGMSKEQQQIIFDKFTQADNSTTRKYGGTGLGMSIAQTLVEQMGGKMHLQSRPGMGTRFRVDMDFFKADKASEVEIDRPFIEASPKTILVGEDNVTNQKVIQKILALGNYNMKMVDNGGKLIEELEKGQYDCVIADMHMPVMGGVEAVKLFRSQHPDKDHIPIIVLTADATTAALQTCQQAGIDAFLTKPVTTEKLVNTINTLLTKKQTAAGESGDEVECPYIDNDEFLEVTRLFKNDEDGLNRLVESYIADNRENMEKIITAGQRADYTEIADMAHKINGSSRSIGATRTARAAKKLEQSTRTNDLNNVDDQIDVLSKNFTATCALLRDFSGNATPGHDSYS